MLQGSWDVILANNPWFAKPKKRVLAEIKAAK